MSAFGGKADIPVAALGTPVTIRRRYPISMAYRSLQKQHRSFVSRQTVFKEIIKLKNSYSSKA
jgi:hypothetical protein